MVMIETAATIDLKSMERTMVLLNTAKSYRVSAVGYEAPPDHTTRQARYSAGLIR